MERVLGDGVRFFELRVSPDQGRCTDHGVEHGAHDKSLAEEMIAADEPDTAWIGETAPRLFVSDKFDGAHQANRAHFTNEWIILETSEHPRQRRARLFLDARH